MGISVKINQDLYESARVASKNERRTIAGQIEFWVKVGRPAIDNPDVRRSEEEDEWLNIRPVDKEIL